MRPVCNSGLATAVSRRRFLRWIGLGTGASLVTPMMFGCRQREAGTESTPIQPGTPTPQPPTPGVVPREVTPTVTEGRFGGIFRAATLSTPPTLDVMTNVAAATREAAWFFLESLITYSEDYQIIPLLAESWEISDDGLVYTFQLKRGVKFHNGDEMTAEDVVASVKRFLEVTPRKAAFALLESYEASDEYTVAFRLSKPSSVFLDALAYPVGYLAIMPKEIIEGKPAGEIPIEEMIGTGPYRLAEFKPDQITRLVRFDEYHAATGTPDGLGGGKIPYFDEIHLIPVPEAGARVAGLEAGDYDWIASVPYTDYDRLKSNPDITPVIVQDVLWPVIMFNHANPLSANLSFRRAIQAALDLEAIANAIVSGRKEFYRLQPSLWFPSSPWYNDAGSELYNIHDVERAKRLLADSGYNGEEIIMVTNRNYDNMYKTIVTAAEQLRNSLGLNTKVEVLDWPGQRARWREANSWHMSTTWYSSQALFAPDAFAAIFACSATSDERAGYCNQEIDEWFAKAAAATTIEERKEAYTNIQRLFYEDIYGIKVADIFDLQALRSNIKGWRPWYNPTRFWGVWRED